MSPNPILNVATICKLFDELKMAKVEDKIKLLESIFKIIYEWISQCAVVYKNTKEILLTTKEFTFIYVIMKEKDNILKKITDNYNTRNNTIKLNNVVKIVRKTALWCDVYFELIGIEFRGPNLELVL